MSIDKDIGKRLSNRLRSQGRRLQPGRLNSVDRAAWLVMAVVAVAIALLLLLGDNSSARVRSFSWGDQTLAAPDRAFIMTFNRPVDRDSVEKNLMVRPPLSGRFSWSGARMAYTLDEPVRYGETFSVRLEGAKTLPLGLKRQVQAFEAFRGTFSGRDEVLAYVGVDGEETDRLVLYNVTQQLKKLLTPPDLLVTDFLPFPDRDRILFGASLAPDPASSQNSDESSDGVPLGANISEQQLYTVTTGLGQLPIKSAQNPLESVQQWFSGWLNSGPAPAGELKLVLDAEKYQNLKFDLAPNGQTVVVQRVERNNPDEFGLWAIVNEEPPERIPTKQGGEFLIAPDSQALAMTQGEGLAILPLPDSSASASQRRNAFRRTIEPLEFLPKFGELLNFSPDGTAAALVKFNKDYTRSLYIARNNGEELELGNINGSIRSAEFSPNGGWLYCLLAEVVGDPGAKNYQEQPYIAAFDLGNKESQPLLLLPDSQDIQMDLAPDGRSLLFSRPVLIQNPDKSRSSATGEAETGQAIEASATVSQLWLLKTLRSEEGEWVANDPEALPISGARPRWLP
ncbi:MAG: hypothetical protein AAF889_08965 [Cyanobacteria bacterium P01_D01_bin.73]